MFFPRMRCIAQAFPVARNNLKSSFRHLSNASQKSRTIPNTPQKAANPQLAGSKGHSHKANALATAIFNAGRTQIYRNSAVRGYIGTSLGIMALSYCGVGYIYSTKLWDISVAKERGLKWFVPVSYQVTMVVWGVFAAYALTRTLGVVRAINLVKQGDKVLLETVIRRPIPFIRPERLLSEPHTLVVNKSKLLGSVYEGMIVAAEGESIGTKLTRMLFYTPFHNTRKALGGVGLVNIQVGPLGEQRNLKIDVDGQFSDGGRDFMDLAKDEI